MPEQTPAFFPSAPQAARLKRQIDRRLLESLRYLLEVAREGAAISIDRQLADLHRAEEGRLSCLMFVLHDRLLRAIRGQDVALVRELVSLLGRLEMTAEEPVVGAYGSGLHSELAWAQLKATLNAAYQEEYGGGFALSSPSGEDVAKTKAVVLEALDLIRQVDPESYGEYRALVTDVVLIASDSVVEGTCFNALGCIYLQVAQEKADALHFGEMLVHEVAHHVLYAYWAQEALIKNDREELYQSPFRSERRPLSGIFHALCVLGRMYRFVKLVESAGDSLPLRHPPSSQVLASRTRALEQRFLATHKTICEHADLSSLGREILGVCERLVSAQPASAL